MKKQTICRYIIHIQSQNLEVYVSVQKLNFFSKTENFTSPLLRSETKSTFFSWSLGMTQTRTFSFFAIIWAKMDEIQKFLRELFRINGDIYDAKYEVHLNNIKWSGA